MLRRTTLIIIFKLGIKNKNLKKFSMLSLYQQNDLQILQKLQEVVTKRFFSNIENSLM